MMTDRAGASDRFADARGKPAAPGDDLGSPVRKGMEKAVLRLRGWVHWRALILAPTLWLGTGPAMAEDACLARVLDRYCLGGDLTALRAQGPPPVIEQTQGEHRALVYQEGPERIYVLSYRGRIYKVVRRYPGATQLRFEELYQTLRARHGAGEDRSEFPAYADTPGRRQAAIRRGEGRAVHVWRPAEGWHVELSWTREMGLALAYLATALDAEQRAANGAGL